jgi:hypothetical protein
VLEPAAGAHGSEVLRLLRLLARPDQPNRHLPASGGGDGGGGGEGAHESRRVGPHSLPAADGATLSWTLDAHTCSVRA